MPTIDSVDNRRAAFDHQLAFPELRRLRPETLMFTSEPSLAQRIERMIGDVPIVDTRSNIQADRPAAPDLAALLDATPVRDALGAVGMPIGATDPARSAEDRVASALPFLRQIRNTSAAWCLFRIFRDLYDFDEPHLALDNVPGLMDRVARSANDPDWPRHVLRDRCEITTLVAPSLVDQPDPIESLSDMIVHRLDIVAGNPVEGSDRVRTGVFDELDLNLEGRVRFAAFPDLPDLDHPVHAAVLEWHDLHHWPLQVVLDQHSPSANLPDRVESMVLRYPQARFGLMAGSTEIGSKVSTLAGRLPNVFAEGFCGLGASPGAIEQNVVARIGQVGSTKIGGFASGAATAEWVYGSLQATKKATASALARAVSGGFFEEDELPPLIRALFSTSPLDWYRLKD